MTLQERKDIIDVMRAGLMECHSLHEAPWIADHIEESLGDKATPSERNKRALEIVARRKKNEPLAYIFGEWSFRNHEFFVSPGVLIPRPETEELVEAILKTVENSQMSSDQLLQKSFVMADFGAGSGCLGLSLVCDLIRDIALDGLDVDKVSAHFKLILIESQPQALSVLKKNVIRYQEQLRQSQVEVFEGHWSDYCKKNSSPCLDLMVSNPPYVTSEEYAQVEPSVLHEPKTALVPESIDKHADASGAYRELLELGQKILKPGGWIWFELGLQHGSWILDHVREVGGYNDIRTLKDMTGRTRFFCAKRS